MQINKRRIRVTIPIILMIVVSFYFLKFSSPNEKKGHPFTKSIAAFSHDLKFWWYDFKMQYRPAAETSPVTVAAIDDTSLNRFGRWPWNRGVFSEILEHLFDAGAKAVVFDVVFSEPEYQSEQIRKSLSVPVPGRGKSLVELNDLSPKQVESLSKELPEVGDLYFAQSIWAHIDRVVLGYFWFSEGQCQVVSSDEMDSKTSKRLGLVHETQWQSNLTLIMPQSYSIETSFKDIDVGLSPWQMCPTVNRGAIGSYARHQGFFNADSDLDGIYRRSHMLAPFRGNTEESIMLFPSIALLGFFVSQGFESWEPVFSNTSSLSLEGVQFKGKGQLYFHPTNKDGSFFVDFKDRNSKSDLFINHVSLGRVGLWNENEKSLIRDKVILVGPTTTGVFDLRPNPVDPRGAGVELHAHALSQMIETHAGNKSAELKTFSWKRQFVLYLVFAMALMYSVLFVQRGVVTSIWWIAIGAGFIADYLLVRLNVFSGYSLVAVLCSVTLMLVTLFLYFIEEKERRFLRKAFVRYVSPEVVSKIEINPDELKLTGERKEITVLFSDIRGFTGIAEELDPQDLRKLLNELFKPMTEIITKNNGTVDKFIGDSIMALFGAPIDSPKHPQEAFLSSVQMVREIQSLAKSSNLLTDRKLFMGVALATGNASVGNMGTDQIFNYTALGDVVNLSSRLESLSKEYSTPLLISESCYQRLSSEDQSICRMVDHVRVSGRTTSVKIYDVPSLSISNPNDLEGLFKGYSEAFESYENGNFDAAAKTFSALSTIDSVSSYMKRRCELGAEKLSNRQWSGVWNFDKK